MLFSLSYVRQQLWPYVDQRVPYASATATQLADATFRINQATERIIGSGKWKNTLRRILIPVYDEYVTLPRELGSVLSITGVTDSGCCAPFTIFTKFHQIAESCLCGTCAAISISETAQTFITPDAPFTFRVKSTVTSGTITFYGGYDEDGEQFNGGDTVNITNGSADGTRTYGSMPETGGIQKTVTTVPVELYSVDSDGNETLIAVYAPYETIPAYKRYRIPNCSSQFTSALVLGKIGYVPVSQDYDIVIPSNLGALKIALKALRSEDTEEDDSADKDWERVYRILNAEVEETDVDSEFPLMRVESEYGSTGIYSLI